jgi:BirA family biotin operon repressor/biotin-[acetyl-CoA-carboxylase] ligase
LSAAIALGTFDFFSKYAGEATKIKWPNDLYWNDRKAGGILIENIFRDKNWEWAIAGVGINVNQVDFGPGLKNPVSLKQITSKEYVLENFARELQQKILERVGQLQDSGSKNMLFGEYQKHLYKRGESVKLKKGNIVFSTTVEGVSLMGELLTKDTMERHFNFGEIEWEL